MAETEFARDVRAGRKDPATLRGQPPLTRSTAEPARFGRRPEEISAGRGGGILLVGEPGVGKTRTMEEMAERAWAAGGLVLWGRCHEGEAGRPWEPFAALGELVWMAAPPAAAPPPSSGPLSERQIGRRSASIVAFLLPTTAPERQWLPERLGRVLAGILPFDQAMAVARDVTTRPATTENGDGAANASSGRPASAPPPDPSGATLRREGDYWTLVYAGVTGRLKDMKGLHYLAYLLEHSGHEFHVLDLLAQVTSPAPSECELRRSLRTTDLPLLDTAAKASYRCRLVELREELAEAERFQDTGRAELARTEMDALTEQLATAVGLGGRDRPVGSAAERARTTVTHRIRAVIARIARQHPGLGDHLATRVRTGTYCAYTPDPERPIDWTRGG